MNYKLLSLFISITIILVGFAFVVLANPTSNFSQSILSSDIFQGVRAFDLTEPIDKIKVSDSIKGEEKVSFEAIKDNPISTYCEYDSNGDGKFDKRLGEYFVDYQKGAWKWGALNNGTDWGKYRCTMSSDAELEKRGNNYYFIDGHGGYKLDTSDICNAVRTNGTEIINISIIQGVFPKVIDTAQCSFSQIGNNLEVTFFSGALIDPTFTFENLIANTVLNNITFEGDNSTHLTVENETILLDMSFDTNLSQTTTYDYSSNNNDGTINGDAHFISEGVYSGAFDFDGTGDFITIANEDKFDFNLTDSFSGSAWIKPDILRSGSQTAYAITTKLRGGSPFDGWELELRWNTPGQPNKAVLALFFIDTGSSTKSKIGSTDLLNDVWYNVAFNYSGNADSSGMELFVNGIKESPTVENNANFLGTMLNDLDVGIGGRISGTSQAFFNGTIDEVMIFNYSMNSSDVLQIYNNQSKRFFTSGVQEFLDQNISLDGDDTLNWTMPNFQTTLDSNFTGRIGTWESDNGYNVSQIGLSEGLVAYYGMNNNPKFGENSTHVFDYSNNQNNGTAEGDAQPTINGRYAGGFEFDGIDDDKINAGNNTIINNLTAGNLSVTAWVKIKSLDTTTRRIVSKQSTAGGGLEGWSLNYVNGGGNTNAYIFSIAYTGTDGLWGFNDDVIADTWQHIALVYNGGSVSNDPIFYVDGVAKTLDTDTNPTSTLEDDTLRPLVIGNFDNLNRGFNGTIDEVSIHNRTLNADEIKSMYVKGIAIRNYTNYQILTSGNNNFTVENHTNFIAELTYNASTNNFYTPILEGDINIDSFQSAPAVVDNEFPQFVPITDNNATIAGELVRINSTLLSTNGTVFIEYDGTNFTLFNSTITSTIFNFTNNDTVVGAKPYYFGAWGNGTSNNYNTTKTFFHSVNATPSVDNEFPQFFNETVNPANNTAYVNNAIYEFNVTMNSTNGTVIFDFSGTNFPNQQILATNLTGNLFNASIFNLPAGDYSYNFTSWGNGTDANQNISIVRGYTVALATPNGTLTGSTPINFGTASDFEGNETNVVDGDVTYQLFRDNKLVSNPDLTVLGVATYNYTFNTTGGQNFSGGKSIASRLLVVNRVASEVNLTLNETEGNITIVSGTSIALNGTLFTGDSPNPIVLFNDGSIINNGTSPIGNLSTFSVVGEFNITVISFQSQNYTNSFETYFVNVTAVPDNEFPLFSSRTDNNATLVGQIVRINITITSTNGTAFIEYDGTNHTLFNATISPTVFNFTINDTTAGVKPYYFGAFGNGTSANFNTTLTFFHSVNTTAFEFGVLNIDYVASDYGNNSYGEICFNMSSGYKCILRDLNGSGASKNIFNQDLNTTNNVTFGNVTTTGTFRGLFNWTIVTSSMNWLFFDGASLSFNQTTLNQNISSEGSLIGFNNTENIFDQDLNTTDSVKFSNLNVNNTILLRDANHIFKLNATSEFSDSENTFYLRHNVEYPLGTILFLISALENGVNKTMIIAQIGKNESGGVLGNSWMIIPNNISTNLTFYTNVFDVTNFLGIDPRIDFDTAGTGSDLLVHDDIQLGGKIFAENGIRSANDVDYFMNGFDFDIFNGSLHLRTPVRESIGLLPGVNGTIFAEDFDDGTLEPFINLVPNAQALRNWFVLSSVNCFNDECARSQGGNGGQQRIMEANITTTNFENIILNFSVTTLGIVSGDLINVTVNNNTGSNQEQLYANFSVLSNEMINISLPSSMENTTISLRFIFEASSQFKEGYINNIILQGSAIQSTEINVTRLDTIFKMGAGTGDGIVYTGDEADGRSEMNFTADSINFIGNATFVSVTEQEINVTENAEIGGTLLVGGNATFQGNVSAERFFGSGDGLTFDSIKTNLINSTSSTLDLETISSIDDIRLVIAGTELFRVDGGDGFGHFSGDLRVNGGLIENSQGTDLVLRTNFVSNQLVLDLGGNIGINTASPQQTLNVLGSVNITEDLIVKNFNFSEFLYNQTVAGVSGATTNIFNQNLNSTNNVRFNNLSLGGNLSVGSNDFFVNPDTGRVVIGGNAPENTFEILETNNVDATSIIQLRQLGTFDASVRLRVPATSWTYGIDNSDADTFKITEATSLGVGSDFAITTGGFIGINTASPQQTFNVDGTGNFTGSLSISEDVFINSTTFGIGTLNPNHDIDFQSGDFAWNEAGEDKTFELFDADTESLVFVDAGLEMVGIITANPQQTLNVVGDINATGRIFSGALDFTTTGPTDNLDVSGINMILMDTSGAAPVTIGGFTNGVRGQVLHITCVDITDDCKLENNEAGGSQNIFLSSGLDETATVKGQGWTLISDGSDWYDTTL